MRAAAVAAAAVAAAAAITIIIIKTIIITQELHSSKWEQQLKDQIDIFSFFDFNATRKLNKTISMPPCML